VKNLENVQGDERDVMLFSITFGFDAAGKFPIDFGAINRDGGERRLNVAVTRARQELIVFASFLPDQLRAERSAARGIRDLKAFLEYADKGPKALVARTEGPLGGYESPLEEAVAAALQERGWHVDPQVGVSGFRIDLGIVHPDKPGAYLAAVECDGATYHRSAVARDRDKTRQQVLENLGWAIVRVWSTDWWYDPENAVEQVHCILKELLLRARKEQPDEQLLPQGAVPWSETAADLPEVHIEPCFNSKPVVGGNSDP
jgi:very-short-patch-repair endonuclease